MIWIDALVKENWASPTFMNGLNKEFLAKMRPHDKHLAVMD
jgi:hypothetical protein